MVNTTLEVSQAVENPIEVPGDMALSRVAELAQVYILGRSNPLSDADLYLANKALLNTIDIAEEEGLTPRDVIISLLRPILDPEEHCRCASCQARCLVCMRTADRGSEKPSY